MAEAPRRTSFMSNKSLRFYVLSAVCDRMFTTARMSSLAVASHEIWCLTRRNSSKEVIGDKGNRERAYHALSLSPLSTTPRSYGGK